MECYACKCSLTTPLEHTTLSVTPRVHTTLKSSHTRRALSLPFNALAELSTFNVLIKRARTFKQLWNYAPLAWHKTSLLLTFGESGRFVRGTGKWAIRGPGAGGLVSYGRHMVQLGAAISLWVVGRR